MRTGKNLLEKKRIVINAFVELRNESFYFRIVFLMPIVGVRKILLPVVFDFTADPLMEFFFENEGIEVRRYNVIWFAHIFFIPLIPVWYGGALRKEEGRLENYYERKITWRGVLINYGACIGGAITVLMLIARVHADLRRGNYRVRVH